jgi:metal-responsive CopG/Arc/MetJ family transcriptional regulator
MVEDLIAGLDQLKQRDGITASEAIRRAVRRLLEDKKVLRPERRAAAQKR